MIANYDQVAGKYHEVLIFVIRSWLEIYGRYVSISEYEERAQKHTFSV